MRKDSNNVLMDFSSRRQLVPRPTASIACKFCVAIAVLLVLRSFAVSPSPGSGWFREKSTIMPESSASSSCSIRKDKFLAVPPIAWGLNNQKIAFARACLTARLLNRTLLMPTLSASLFYKEVDLFEPITFDKVFQFRRFNRLCNGFVRLGRYSDLLNQTEPFVLQKGSGRKWTMERDMDQLRQCGAGSVDASEVVRIVGKNPFLWHDHWPVVEYARVFQCLVLVDEIQNEAAKVMSVIRGIGIGARNRSARKLESSGLSGNPNPYVAVHLRIEKDWMIHCKKLERKRNLSQICSSKEEIMERVARIDGLGRPVVAYLAVADSLLEDGTILSGWEEGILPFEKKKLGVWEIYKKHPYLIQSAIDYEVCLRADVFVGNSFSTFSSLVVLERTLKLVEAGVSGRSCGADLTYASFAYNVLGELGGARRWVTDLTASSLEGLSYGSSNISCRVEVPKSDPCLNVKQSS